MLNLSRGRSPGGSQLRKALLEKSGRHFSNLVSARAHVSCAFGTSLEEFVDSLHEA
jgi:hypothetical protein